MRQFIAYDGSVIVIDLKQVAAVNLSNKQVLVNGQWIGVLYDQDFDGILAKTTNTHSWFGRPAERPAE
jgi:myo-inositol catabolism protein IolC